MKSECYKILEKLFPNKVDEMYEDYLEKTTRLDFKDVNPEYFQMFTLFFSTKTDKEMTLILDSYFYDFKNGVFNIQNVLKLCFIPIIIGIGFYLLNIYMWSDAFVATSIVSIVRVLLQFYVNKSDKIGGKILYDFYKAGEKEKGLRNDALY